MRKIILYIPVTAFAILIFSCKGSNKEHEFPKPGTVVASGETKSTEDTLNHFVFSVKVSADSDVTSGVYDVNASYGPNNSEGKFTLPKKGEASKIEMRRGSAPCSFVIGFKVEDDTTFYEYFEVSSNHSATKMQYIKSYSF